jgi:hypothetical protein
MSQDCPENHCLPLRQRQLHNRQIHVCFWCSVIVPSQETIASTCSGMVFWSFTMTLSETGFIHAQCLSRG